MAIHPSVRELSVCTQADALVQTLNRSKLRLARKLVWLPLILLVTVSMLIRLHGRQKVSPVLPSRPNCSRAVPEPSLVACANCSNRQHATTTALRGMQRVPPPPWGAADVWAYPNLYSDAFAGNPRPLVFALVMTSPDRREQRNAIRETWGRESSYPKHMFRLVFFMNMVPHQNETQIKAEVNAYNDLVVQPSGSLSSLSSLMTEWATERIWISRLVLLLSRDDCFVNVRALLTNAYQLMRGNFDVTGRRRDAKRVENAKRSTAKGSHVAKEDVEDAGGKYRRNGRDHGVAVDLAPFEPCVLLVRGYNVFRQFQSVWAWFDSNASFADESFFSGRIALKAKATLAHVDAVGPCMGERLSSTFRRSGTLTSCGHPVVKVRALHKELVQRLSNAAKKRNETALLIAQWKRALTPERID